MLQRSVLPPFTNVPQERPLPYSRLSSIIGTVERLEELYERAEALHVPPSMVVKSHMGRAVVCQLSGLEGLVLQGGGAVHHVYGSPRFSADVDYARSVTVDEARLIDALESVCRRIEREWAWGACELEQATVTGRLRRQKLVLCVRPQTRLVLAIESYDVPVHQPRLLPLAHGEEPGTLVPVEAPAEIIADKLAASIDRWATRGSIKLRDLYDIDLLLDRERPDRSLLKRKLADYGLPSGSESLAEIAATLGPFTRAELLEQLRGVLPRIEAERLDTGRLLERVGGLFRELSA